MKLFCHPSSTNCLKALIAKEVAAATVHVASESVHPDSKLVPYLLSSRLPILQLDDGQFIFCENAACDYLFRKCGEAPTEREALAQLHFWLEWETTQLRDQIADAERLGPFLTQLNGALSSTHLIPSAGLTAADVVVWVTLRPFLEPWGPDSDRWLGLDHLKRWFLRLRDHPAFLTAVEKWSSAPRPARPYNLLEQKFEDNAAEKTTTSSIKSAAKKSSDSKNAKGKIEKTVANTDETAKPEVSPVSPERKAATLSTWQPSCSDPDPAPPNRLQPRNHPILPEKGRRNVMITSALPYVNNVPHLGNIIGCVLSADVFSRYCRLTNENVVYFCGTDEYGTATETKAIQEGLTPREICDKYNAIHADIYEWFNVDFDHFGRTTSEQQTKIAQDIFWRLYEEGLILKEAVDQLHCGACDKFLADRFVEGICPYPGCGFEDARGDQCDQCGKLVNATELKNPRCKTCNGSPSVRTSEHLFLDLPSVEPKLRAHLDNVFEGGHWTSNAKLITKSWLRDGLKPRCITRDLKWGTPVPLEGYQDKVFYVWFDAPIGYLSIAANYSSDWEKWWKNPEEVDLFQFMAKDNVPFHSVIFPATQLGAKDGYTVVNHLVATEYLNYEDGKFSKSRGVGVFGNDAKDTGIPADVWRFYLLYLRPESQDSAFNWVDFATKNNSELLNNLGNFLNRPYPFIVSKFGGLVPGYALEDADVALIVAVDDELRVYHDLLSHVRLRDGVRSILAISALGNKYIQDQEPWKLIKSPETARRAETVIAVAAHLGCLLGLLLGPYMPETSRIILETILGLDEKLEMPRKFAPLLKEGHRIGTPMPLFKKIEPDEIESLKRRFAGRQAGSKSASPSASEDIADLTSKITAQGDVVRRLKSDKAPKPDVDAAVATLLDLKKRLAAATGEPPSATTDKKGKKSNKKEEKKVEKPSPTPVANGVDAAEVARLSALVKEQGDAVRAVKARLPPPSKEDVDVQVAKLLELKKSLALASGEDPASVGGGKQKKKKK